jgi:multiple sugar transport system substrate-binding protein
VPGLDFDVMPMPRIERRATIGDFTGLCIAAGSGRVSQAADFLVHAISEEALDRVVGAGYLAPANLDVATSPTFLQPEQRPAHAGVFNTTVGDMVLQPLIDEYGQLERAIQGSLRSLLRAPVLDLDALTTQIDEESRAVLDPDYEPDPSEGPDGSESPSGTGEEASDSE